METFDFIEMRIPAKAEYVGVVRLTLSGIANRMGFSYDAIEDLKVAISEAATNVVTHAYEEDSTGEIALGFGVHEDRLEIMVSDNGESFKFEDIKGRMGPINQAEINQPQSMKEGGFGLFLINALMDKVELNNSYGVLVHMTKYLDENGVTLDEQVEPSK